MSNNNEEQPYSDPYAYQQQDPNAYRVETYAYEEQSYQYQSDNSYAQQAPAAGIPPPSFSSSPPMPVLMRHGWPRWRDAGLGLVRSIGERIDEIRSMMIRGRTLVFINPRLAIRNVVALA